MNSFAFPLGQNVHDADDIQVMIDCLKTEKFTMGDRTEEFEKAFAKYLGVKYAVQVNSGSSANLLAIAALANYKCKKLQPGDEVLIPAVCWSTSLFPITQYQMIPVFVDTNPKTLNIDLDDLERKITSKTKALMAVHVLGNCCDMRRLIEIVKKHNLILIEDTCESLGSSYDGKYLGTFGDIGTYSFYYSHHITSIEGGCCVTNDEQLYELIKCLRAHGWTRNLKNKEEIAKQNPDLSPQFTFCNLGFNLRPMETQSAMALNQLAKLKIKNDNRKINYYKIKEKIEKDSRNTFLSFPESNEFTDAVWFGIVFFIKNMINGEIQNLQAYCNYLTEKGVETRSIISGNFLRQPVIKDLYPTLKPEDFPGAEVCHFRGLFIGLSCTEMSDEKIDELVEILLGYKCCQQ